MTPREVLARELRLQHERRRVSQGYAPLAPWEELPHERKVKWLELAAVAERTVAERNPVRFASVLAAVAELDSIDAADYEKAHSRADEILRAFAPAEIANAYARLENRAPNWPTA